MTENLQNVLYDLSKHKRDRNTLLMTYVEERLNKSLQSYYEELTDSFDFLKYKNSQTVLDKMNR